MNPNRRIIPLKQYQAEAKAQNLPNPQGFHVAGICPACGTIQSIQDFIALEICKNFDDASRYAHFSCIGRWTAAGPATEACKTRAAGCDWTLGGLFHIHTLTVTTGEGKEHARFELASPEQAQIHAALSNEERIARFRGTAQTT